MYTPANSSVVEHTTKQVILGHYTTGKLNFAVGQIIPANTPVAIKTADSLAYPHDPAAADGTQKAVAINVHDIDTTIAAAVNPVYLSGYLNANEIQWDVTIDSIDKQRATFAGTGFNIDQPY
jgi:hypothetical protein